VFISVTRRTRNRGRTNQPKEKEAGGPKDDKTKKKNNR
jgi:hypothetical protein